MSIKVEGVAPLIQVFDMPTSVAFYRDVLGFELAMSRSLALTSIGACSGSTERS